MRLDNRGYMLILVLIVLGAGTLLVTTSLRIASTSIKSKQINTSEVAEQYARDGAAEFAVWELLHATATQQLTEPNQEKSTTLTLNGVEAVVSIKLRAEEGLSGGALAQGNFGTLPQKSVVPNNPTAGVLTTFTYTVTLIEMDPDFASVAINEIWDQLPPSFSYVAGTSVFEGSGISDPADDYDSGNDIHTLHWIFSPDITFSAYGEEKTLVFDAQATPSNNTRYCNEVAFKPFDERIGKDALIEVGSPPSGCPGGRVRQTATSDPLIAVPNLLTTFTYTFSYENMDIGPHLLDGITIYLAPGFTYVNDSALDSGNLANANPAISIVDGREELKWDSLQPSKENIPRGGTEVQVFQATATLTQSGSSYVEGFAILADACNYSPCSLPGDASKAFSWQVGAVIVPQYDIKSEAETTRGQGNVDVTGGGGLQSWNVTDKSVPLPTPTP